MKEIRTKEELKIAVAGKVTAFIIVGDLANKIQTASKVKKLSKVALIALTAALAAMPFTAGLSAVAVAPMVITTGLSAGTIIAIGAVGLTLLLSFLEKYNYEATKDSSGKMTIKATRK